MKSHSDTRRQLLRAGLAVPLLGSGVLQTAAAGADTNADTNTGLVLPERLLAEARNLYGYEAEQIALSSRVVLHVPEVAENQFLVPVRVGGEPGMVSSIAILVAKGDKPLAGFFTLYEGSDLPLRLWIRMPGSSALYMLARTAEGLVGAKAYVKVTSSGCGG